MKTLFTLLLVCATLTLRAQIITYDYKTSRSIPSDSCCVPQNATIRYRIININPFAEKAIINGTMLALNSEMPQQLKTLFGVEADEAKAKLDNSKEQLGEMVDVNNDVKKAVVAEKDAAKKELPVAPVKGATKKAAGIVDVKDSTKNAVANALASEERETNELVEYCRDYLQKADKITDALSVENRLLETMSDGINYNDVLMRQALKNRGIDSDSIAKLRSDYTAFVEAYDKVYYQYREAAKAAEVAKDEGNKAKIEAAQRQIEKDFEALRKLYNKTLDKLDELFAKAVNPGHYAFVSDPIGVNEGVDAILFSIRTGKIDTPEDKLSVHNKTLWVRGGWKVDYSMGPVANFIKDDQYFFGAGSGKDTTKVLRARADGTYFSTVKPTVATMIHLYKRQCKGTAFGGTFGINAAVKEFTDINLGFLAGVSAIFGRDQKVIVSSGFSYLSVNRLKAGQYNVGTAYPGVKIEDVTERVLQPSWFLAVSLSIGKRTVIKPTP